MQKVFNNDLKHFYLVRILQYNQIVLTFIVSYCTAASDITAHWCGLSAVQASN